MNVAGWGKAAKLAAKQTFPRLFLWSETGHCVPGGFLQFSVRIAPNDAPGSEAVKKHTQ